MKIIYDKEHDACAVEFDASDCIFTSIEDGKIFMHSSNGGKPEIVDGQLLFSVDDINKESVDGS